MGGGLYTKTGGNILKNAGNSSMRNEFTLNFNNFFLQFNVPVFFFQKRTFKISTFISSTHKLWRQQNMEVNKKVVPGGLSLVG